MGYGTENKKILMERLQEKHKTKPKPKSSSDMIDKGLEVLAEKTKDEITGEPDKIFKYLDMAKTYAPLLIELIKGFTDSKNAHQMQMQQQMAQQVRPAPYGYELWRNMSKMQRVGYKYDSSRFNYDECVNYDNYLASLRNYGNIQPVNPSNYQYMQPVNQQSLPYSTTSTQPRETLATLAKKYPEPPLVNDVKPIENNGDELNESNTKDKGIIEVETQEGKREQNQGQTESSKSEQSQEQPKEQEVESDVQLKAVEEQLIAENQKWLDMIIKFLTNAEMEKFKGYIADIDNLVGKAKDYFWIIPFSVKNMFKTISTERWIEEFKTQCPDKYQYLEESKQLQKITELFDKLKEEL